jgi:hypothetical protein
MSDLDLLVTGVVVTFIALTGAYVAIRHRANEAPVPSFKPAGDNLPAREAVRPHNTAS